MRSLTVPMVCGLHCCIKLTNPLLYEYGYDPGGLYQMGFIKVLNVGRVHRG